MKKNTIFMWAYITAICLAALARPLLDDGLWGSIVLAITVSSAIFAVEDLLSAITRYLRDLCDITEDYVSKAKPHAIRDKEFYEKQKAKISAEAKIAGDFADLQAMHDKVLSKIKEFIDHCEETEANITAGRKRIEKYEKITNILAYFGFLCLFVIVFLSPHLSLPNVILEIITVLSFAVILSTQQLNQYFLSENKKNIDKCKTLLSQDEQQEDTYLHIEKNLEEMIDRRNKNRENHVEIERLQKEMERLEALEHAD